MHILTPAAIVASISATFNVDINMDRTMWRHSDGRIRFYRDTDDNGEWRLGLGLFINDDFMGADFRARRCNAINANELIGPDAETRRETLNSCAVISVPYVVLKGVLQTPLREQLSRAVEILTQLHETPCGQYMSDLQFLSEEALDADVMARMNTSYPELLQQLQALAPCSNGHV
jgi:hypothetical protein